MEPILLIPIYQPGPKTIAFFQQLKSRLTTPLVIVDDGSGLEDQATFEELLADYPQATFLSYDQNQGKGFALKFGIAYINQHFPETAGIVTADGDGQHSLADIQKMLAKVAMMSDETLLLGVREFNKASTPFKSYWGNHITSLFYRFATGIKLTDTQTGLRGFTQANFVKLARIPGNRFEYEMNVLMDLPKLELTLATLPIETIYQDNNEHSHFRPIQDSILVYQQFFKFIASSGLSAVLDILLFYLFYQVFGQLSYGLFAVTVLARVLSGIFNFSLNRKMVFASTQKPGHSAGKYLALFLAQMFFSWLGVLCLSQIIPLVMLAKIITDVFLFFASYQIQRRFVFE